MKSRSEQDWGLNAGYGEACLDVGSGTVDEGLIMVGCGSNVECDEGHYC